MLLSLFSRLTELTWVTSKSTTTLGSYHGEEFQLIKRLSGQGRYFFNVLDVGANNGDWAAEFLKLMPRNGSKILAIEPIEDFYKHSQVNQDSRITFLNCAISLKNGTLQIAEIGNGGSAFFGEINSKYGPSKNRYQHSVKTHNGDWLVAREKFLVDFIKIDTDGMDFIILQSLQETIKSLQPIIQFEFSFRFARNANYTLQDNINFLKSLDYSVFVIDRYAQLKAIKCSRLEVLNHQTKNFWAIPNENKVQVLQMLTI
jgi:FkbM family methyltransferase